MWSAVVELYEATPAERRAGLLFTTPDGGMIWPQLVTAHHFPRLRAAARVNPDATTHTLRHTHATLLDEVLVSDALKAGILGHGKKGITARYTHARIEAMRRALALVEARVIEGRAAQAQ